LVQKTKSKETSVKRRIIKLKNPIIAIKISDKVTKVVINLKNKQKQFQTLIISDTKTKTKEHINNKHKNIRAKFIETLFTE
jgi:hypothetical protein